MTFFTLIGIAVGLSFDAFTVALTNGTVIKALRIKHGFAMALAFGSFQFIMPVIGWAGGAAFSAYIEAIDHWIAFGLLAFVGGKMIVNSLPFKKRAERNSLRDKSGDGCPKNDCRNPKTLLLLAVATSIDALAVGVGFAVMHTAVFFPALCIGTVTFALSLAGYFIGKTAGAKITIDLEIIGGIILIGMGIKILIEHLSCAAVS